LSLINIIDVGKETIIGCMLWLVPSSSTKSHLLEISDISLKNKVKRGYQNHFILKLRMIVESVIELLMMVYRQAKDTLASIAS